MLLATVALVSILAGLWLLRSLFEFWQKLPAEYRPPSSLLAALVAQLQRLAVAARRFVLVPRYAALLVMATWATFLLAPGTAHASGIGDVNLGQVSGVAGLAIGGLFALASAFHIADKIVGWVKNAQPTYTTIAGHPKATEALDALEHAGVEVVQDLVTAHPDALDLIAKKLQSDSLSNVGIWLAATYGPELMKDLIKRGQELLGIELSLVFGGQKAVTEAAMNRLGVAASRVVATNKVFLQAPSGRTIVAPAAS